MTCPLCSQTMFRGKDVYTCPLKIVFNPSYATTHFHTTKFFNSIRHVMIVMPYRVVTFENNYSVIQMHTCDGFFDTILDTRELHIPPIIPTEQSALLNRIETILVFS